MPNKLRTIEQIVAAIADEIGGDFAAAARIAGRLFPQGGVGLEASNIAAARCVSGEPHLHFYLLAGDNCLASVAVDVGAALDFAVAVHDEIAAFPAAPAAPSRSH